MVTTIFINFVQNKTSATKRDSNFQIIFRRFPSIKTQNICTIRKLFLTVPSDYRSDSGQSNYWPVNFVVQSHTRRFRVLILDFKTEMCLRAFAVHMLWTVRWLNWFMVSHFLFGSSSFFHNLCIYKHLTHIRYTRENQTKTCSWVLIKR